MTAADDSYIPPEQRARRRIDAMLAAAGWLVQDYRSVDLYAGTGVAVRELVTSAGPADYVLFVDRQAVGVIEAKRKGTTLSGVEWQTVKYQANVPEALPSFLIDGRLPYGYESTGGETWFTCRMDPEPTARRVFWFHRPETLEDQVADYVHHHRGTLRASVPDLPQLEEDPGRLRQAQFEAITNLELSLRDNHPRALIQMATGSGKTFAAANICERLIRHARAKRILFLVDRANLGKQTLKEFQGFEVPGSGRKFTELYNVQHLTHNHVDPVASVCIGTIQRVYSMLRAEAELPEDLDEQSGYELAPDQPVEVDYNPALPIELFDVIIVDECHRSIYGVWRQVLEYFDAFLIGLTATPGKQTFGFFNKNLVMEYGFPEAVADKVNVDFDVFRLSTAISEGGSTIEAGYWTTFRDRETRDERLEHVDEDLTYDATALDKRVVAKDQIRTVIRELRDNLPAIFPDRELDEHGRVRHIPKTLIFAKDDSHAEDIVRVAREELSRGNDVIAKITYKPTGNVKPEQLLQDFRTSYFPRIAVTVATGRRRYEMVVFMRPRSAAPTTSPRPTRTSRSRPHRTPCLPPTCPPRPLPRHSASRSSAPTASMRRARRYEPACVARPGSCWPGSAAIPTAARRRRSSRRSGRRAIPARCANVSGTPSGTSAPGSETPRVFLTCSSAPARGIEPLARIGLAEQPEKTPDRGVCAWSKSAVRVILHNPRYTGRQVWNRQRRDEVLIDVEDVALGHETKMRWNGEGSWVWSADDAHEALVTPELFARVQELAKAAEHRPMAPKRRTTERRYALSGLLACGICNRRMQGNWNHGAAHYRCRFPNEYSLANRVDHPLTVYIREDAVVPALDDWLRGLGAPERIDETCQALVAASAVDQASLARLEAAHRKLADCDERLAQYRAALDAGADPAMVAGWISEVQGARLGAQLSLNELAPHEPLSMDEARQIADDVHRIGEQLAAADPGEKARLYSELGLRLTYHPGRRVVAVAASPESACATARVGGRITPVSTPAVLFGEVAVQLRSYRAV